MTVIERAAIVFCAAVLRCAPYTAKHQIQSHSGNSVSGTGATEKLGKHPTGKPRKWDSLLFLVAVFCKLFW